MTHAGVVGMLRHAATSRTSLAVFALLLLMWGGFEARVAPGELFFPLFPAFAVAFFFDTVAYNQLGLRLPWLFYPLGTLFLYVEAVLVGGIVRWVRGRNGASNRPDDT
ncbi:hypothetical protein ELS19_13825 [Halogeometricum borinquense]|uniref:Lycopene cyclase domain-containing protein n=1 Tax=Halogeometricum borinquense TaxID=60847 RepID=A0A482TI99_9EURY|nr:hypothetical protein [Halogeometricum borinquense]RYJ14928.1 hypothetical protein ELS19_13825 [Halogeometricum borinquense]